MKINKRVLKNFHKRFANGEQHLIISNTGEIVDGMQYAYYWQERVIYNRILPMIEMVSIKFKDVIDDDLLYGECGLVSLLVPIQRAYNAVCNRKTEYINRISNGIFVVEDGSIDVDALEEDGFNPNGKVLVYRQGVRIPEIIYPNVAEFDFFEQERQRLLDEFKYITDGFICKLEVLRGQLTHQYEDKGQQ